MAGQVENGISVHAAGIREKDGEHPKNGNVEEII